MFPTLPSLEGGLALRRLSPHASEASPSRLLARILDHRIAPSDGAGPLENALDRTDHLATALRSLPSNQIQTLERALGPTVLAELSNLAEEADPNLFQSELMSFASRQEVSGGVELAAELYQALGASPHGTSGLHERAGQRLDAILGRGAIGLRSESLLRNLAQQACDPTALLAMGVAGAVFRATRLFTLSRLAASPAGSFLTRGLGARVISGMAGFAAEATVFPLSGRLASEALGRSQDWSGRALSRDLASSFLVLGGLRLAGAAGAGFYGRFGGSSELARGAFTQASMFTGILGGHWLEAHFGLRPQVSGATALVDSLATLVQFNVGGRLSQHLLGPRVAAWEQALDAQTELLAQNNSRASGPRLPRWVPALAAVSAAANGHEGEQDPVSDLGRGLQILMSKMDDGRGSSTLEGRSVATGEVAPGTADPSKLDRQISELLLSAGDNLERGLRVFVEGLPFAVAVANMERGNKEFGNIFMVNRRFRELFGYSEKEISEMPLMRFFNPYKSAFIFARIWGIATKGIFHPSDMELRHQDGNWVKIRGAGVVRDLGDRSIAFGFLSPREESTRAAQEEILSAFESSKVAGKRNRNLVTSNDGYIEADSVIALSAQLTKDNSALLQQIVTQDVKIRITNMPWVPDAEGYTAPLLKFFNVQDRKFQFPTGRRVMVEFPASATRPASLISLIKWEEGFRAVGQASTEGNGGTNGGTHGGTAVLFGDLPGAGFPRSTPSVIPPREDSPQPPETIQPAVIDSGTADVLTRIQDSLSRGLRSVSDRITQQDVEIPVQGTFSAVFLQSSGESIAGELQSIVKQQKLGVPLGRRVTLVFGSDRGPIRMVFNKVLGRFEQIVE